MKPHRMKKLGLLVVGLLLLLGCDPNRRKLRYLHSGESYAQQRKYREAAIQFRNAIQVDPKYTTAHYEIALAYLGLHDLEAAYREFTVTVSLAPANTDAQLQLATLEMAHRRFDRAREAAQHVLASDPHNFRAHEILAQGYIATRENVLGGLPGPVEPPVRHLDVASWSWASVLAGASDTVTVNSR